jgi:hypothetical protein
MSKDETFDDDTPEEELEDADEDSEDEEELDEVESYPFRRDQRELVAELNAIVRLLLKRPAIRAEQIWQLGKLLFALERLPLTTPGVATTLALSHCFQGDLSYQNISLDATTFRLGSGGVLNKPTGGKEPFHENLLVLEVGVAPPETDAMLLDDWLIALRRRAEFPEEQITLRESGDDAEIDWDDTPNGSAWDRLAE